MLIKFLVYYIAAYYGINSIPFNWTDKLVKRKLIEDIAIELYNKQLTENLIEHWVSEPGFSKGIYNAAECKKDELSFIELIASKLQSGNVNNIGWSDQKRDQLKNVFKQAKSNGKLK